MPKEDFAVAPMPLGPAGKAFPTMGYAGWAMFKASEHKDESWKLIAHLASRESNLEWAKFVGVIPIYKGAEQDPFFATEQYKGWFTELNDPRWQLTSMPTYLEEFGFFADQISISGGQEALLAQADGAGRGLRVGQVPDRRAEEVARVAVSGLEADRRRPARGAPPRSLLA